MFGLGNFPNDRPTAVQLVALVRARVGAVHLAPTSLSLTPQLAGYPSKVLSLLVPMDGGLSKRQRKRAAREAVRMTRLPANAQKSGSLTKQIVRPSWEGDSTNSVGLPFTSAPLGVEVKQAPGGGTVMTFPMAKAKKKKKRRGSLFDVVSDIIGSVGPGVVGTLGSLLASKSGRGVVPGVEACNSLHSRIASRVSSFGDGPAMGIAFGAANPEQWLRDTVTTKSQSVGETQWVTGADYLETLNNESTAYVQGDTIFELPFNPLMMTNTSLSLEARRFVRWTVPNPGDFLIVFMPSAPTTTLGQMVGYWETDIDIEDINGESAMRRAFSTAGEAPCQLWQPQVWSWVGAVDKNMTSMYTDPGISDAKWSTPGKFVLKAATNIAAGDLQGTLHMMYKDLQFSVHQLNVNVSGQTTMWSTTADTSNNEFLLGATWTTNDEEGIPLNNSINRTLYFGVPQDVLAATITASGVSSTLPLGTLIRMTRLSTGNTTGVPTATFTDCTALPSATTYTRGSTADENSLGWCPTFNWFHRVTMIVTGNLPRVAYSGTSVGTGESYITVTTIPQLQGGMDVADFYGMPVISAMPPPSSRAGGRSSWLPYVMRKEREKEMAGLLRGLAMERHTPKVKTKGCYGDCAGATVETVRNSPLEVKTCDATMVVTMTVAEFERWKLTS